MTDNLYFCRMNQKTLERLLHLSFWTFLFFVCWLVYGQFLSLTLGLLRALVNVLSMAGLFYMILYLVNKYLEQRQYVAFIWRAILMFIFITLLRSESNALFPNIEADLELISSDAVLFFGALLTNSSIFGLAILAQLLFNRYQKERQTLAIISEQRAAELQALRAQINPHFLFNTLNNIYALAVVQSDKTAEMVLRLSNLLRYVVYEGKAKSVALKDEIQQIEAFIELFQMKSEHPLNIRFHKQGDFSKQQIEPMILIPIVENCFKHCDFNHNSAAFIEIHINLEDETLHFQTINTKNGTDQQKDQVGGVGLENIQKRLQLKYENQHKLKVKEEKDVFEVNLNIKTRS